MANHSPLSKKLLKFQLTSGDMEKRHPPPEMPDKPTVTLSTQSAELDALKQRIKQLEDTLFWHEDNCSDTLATIDGLTKELAASQSENAALRKRIEDLEYNCRKLVSHHKQVKKRANSLKQKNASLEVAKFSLRSQVSTLEVDGREIESGVRLLLSDIDTLVERSKVSEVKNEVSEVKNEVSEVKNEVSEVKNEVSEVKDEVKTAPGVVESLQKQVRGLQKHQGKLQGEAMSQRNHARRLERKCERLSREAAESRETKERVEKERRWLQEEMEVERGRVEALREELAAERRRAGAWRRRVRSCMKELETSCCDGELHDISSDDGVLSKWYSNSQLSDQSSVASFWPAEENTEVLLVNNHPFAEFFVMDHNGPRFFLVVPRKSKKVSVGSLREALKSHSLHYESARIYHTTAEVQETKEHVVQIWSDFTGDEHSFAFANERGKRFELTRTRYRHYRKLSSDRELLMVPGSQKAWIEIR